jgi:hypothetical protein
MAAIAVVLLPVLATWAWVSGLRSVSLFERVAIGAAIALSGPSLIFVVWRFLGGDLHTYRTAESLLWMVLAALGFALHRPSRPEPRRLQVDAAIITLAATVVVLAASHGRLVAGLMGAHPHGSWDAWSIWNLRARFLASPGVEWWNAFDPALAWSHPDYPLLLPAAVARAWVLSGTTLAAWPAAISLAFGILTIFTVAGSLWRLGGAMAAALGLALLAVPAFVTQATHQLADIPVGYFAVLALVLLHPSAPGPARLGLAGFSLGLAAWTKNEGLVVAVGITSIYVCLQARSAGWRVALEAARDLAIGLWPMLVLLALFKILVAPPNDLAEGLTRPGVLGYWRDTVRVAFVLRYMASEALTWGGWPIAVGPLLAIGVIAAVPRRHRHQDAVAIETAGILLLSQTAVFTAVYVMTPHSVAWHLTTSWYRLIAQLWPTAVWWAAARWAGRTNVHEAPVSGSPR